MSRTRIAALAALACVATIAALVLAGCGPSAGASTPYASHATVNDPALATPPLQLIDDTGAAFDLASLHGKVVALFFGYTSCPDVCPLTLGELAAARRALPASVRDAFQVVFVTVDPERDTPARLDAYLSKFDPSFIGLSGPPADVEAALAAWGVQHQRVDVQPDGSYAMSHPSTILVLDRTGRWALTSHSQTPPADLAADVDHLLAQPAVASAAAQAAAAAAAAHVVPSPPTATPGARTPSRAVAAGGRPSTLFFAYPDGSVVRVAPGDGGTETVLPDYATQPPPDDSEGGTLRAREVAYDPVTDRLWYAESHDAVHSVDLATGEPGPSLTGFGDVGIVGCSILGNARAMAIDVARRRLLLPQLTGAVLIYDLDTLKLVGGIGPGTFGDIVLGGFRHLAIDPSTGRLWWAAANGDFVEYDLDRGARTGRVVHTDVRAHTLGNAFRGLQVDPARNLLLYQTGPGRLAAVDLSTLAPAPLQAPASGFGHFALAVAAP